MDGVAAHARQGWAKPPGGDVAWVVSPHLLVAQAVAAALVSTGAPVEMHAWDTLVADARAAAGAGERHVVAIFEGLDNHGAVDVIGRLVALGDVRVVVVTSGPEAIWWGGLLDSSAVEVVTVATSVAQLTEVVERFLAGDDLMEPERRLALRSAWQEALDKRRHLISLMRTLSPQQLRVLELLATGRQVAETAELLGVASGTVRSHVRSLRSKLGAKTQLEAVAMLRQVQEVVEAADLVPRPRAAPAGASEAGARR
jgi:DNA-binding NarL/FixJ family response regulator